MTGDRQKYKDPSVCEHSLCSPTPARATGVLLEHQNTRQSSWKECFVSRDRATQLQEKCTGFSIEKSKGFLAGIFNFAACVSPVTAYEERQEYLQHTGSLLSTSLCFSDKETSNKKLVETGHQVQKGSCFCLQHSPCPLLLLLSLRKSYMFSQMIKEFKLLYVFPCFLGWDGISHQALI